MYLVATLLISAAILTIYLLALIDHRHAAEMRRDRVRLDREIRAKRDRWAAFDERFDRHHRKRAAAQRAMSEACKAMNAIRADERRDPGLVGHIYGACYGRK